MQTLASNSLVYKNLVSATLIAARHKRADRLEAEARAAEQLRLEKESRAVGRMGTVMKEVLAKVESAFVDGTNSPIPLLFVDMEDYPSSVTRGPKSHDPDAGQLQFCARAVFDAFMENGLNVKLVWWPDRDCYRLCLIFTA